MRKPLLSFSRVAAAPSRGQAPNPELRSKGSMRDRSYWVYIMSSLSRTLYAGVTNDLERRVFEHQQETPGSFTARYHVNRLV